MKNTYTNDHQNLPGYHLGFVHYRALEDGWLEQGSRWPLLARDSLNQGSEQRKQMTFLGNNDFSQSRKSEPSRAQSVSSSSKNYIK